MILIFPEGGWRELPPDEDLRCENPWLRKFERSMRRQIYTFEHFQSDNVVDPAIYVPKEITSSGWGLQQQWVYSHMPTGARAFDPVIHTPADLKKLHFPEVIYDEALSRKNLTFVQEVIGDLVEVRAQGVARLSFHLMNHYTALRGLEEVMMDMVAEPGWMHEAMSILEEGNRRLVEQYETLNLLELNNDNTYHSTGGNGWTDELPRPGFDPNHIRPEDMWASAESQELTLVSPAMHAEFALPYESRLLASFGLNGYACCDDLTRKLKSVVNIPNIRRISISPFADVDKCAPQLGPGYIFSWKPRPMDLVGKFNPGRIRSYLRHTLEVCRRHACVLEIILKDTHTCEHHPERFNAWCRIAREEVTRLEEA